VRSREYAWLTRDLAKSLSLELRHTHVTDAGLGAIADLSRQVVHDDRRNQPAPHFGITDPRGLGTDEGTGAVFGLDATTGLMIRTRLEVQAPGARFSSVRFVTGTLDPLASGVLVICVGAATRLAHYVQAMGKIYLSRFRLGATSTKHAPTAITSESAE
jgi:hypothetical protein